MGFVRVASIRDVPPDEMKTVQVKGKDVLLINQNGKFYAIGNACTHAGCSLSDGRMYERVVQCICHGSKFDIRTGEAVEGPAQDPEPTYEVKVDRDGLLINI